MKNVQKFAYFMVLDFEATCEKDIKIPDPEIIEFPVLMVNAYTLHTESIFHHYVRPTINPVLSDFCTELTGIIQSMIEDEPELPSILKMFDLFLDKNNLKICPYKFAFVTCGDWDLKIMLPQQCKLLGIDVPDCFKQWINLKQVYCDVMGQFPFSMMSMLAGLNIKHTGRHHSGIDDCRNIANILCELIRCGATPDITGNIR
uniref:SJCHGC03520 protein n=1 Tax=Schistosoma japonicum TaxID=6182 RepID=Q5D9D9_SCHJA|nr:SJCHGC03520 protein [Schistosoma japonicum]